MTIEKRLKSLEINIKNANTKDVVIVCKTVDGDYYLHGEPQTIYTEAEFEQYKARHGVGVVICLWRDKS